MYIYIIIYNYISIWNTLERKRATWKSQFWPVERWRKRLACQPRPHPCSITGTYICDGIDCGDNSKDERHWKHFNGWQKLDCSRLIPVLEHVEKIGLFFNRWKFGSGCVDVAVVCFHYRTAMACHGDMWWPYLGSQKWDMLRTLSTFPPSNFKLTFHRISREWPVF